MFIDKHFMRAFGVVWDHEVAGPNPVAPIEKGCPSGQPFSIEQVSSRTVDQESEKTPRKQIGSIEEQAGSPAVY